MAFIVRQAASEAEWEYAARGGSSTKYSWGGSIGSNNANCDGCGSQWDNKRTAPVAQFRPNAFGLYDMHGNVWEWVQDDYHDNYNSAPSDGSAWSSGGSRRVLRGGSWSNGPNFLRSAFRVGYAPDDRSINFGFRIARTL
ncbi:MAG: formylglycine-generating enzyme family protein [Comamonadaceae bacterium]|nr:formylglycine-generating enzyme family protein [Comamonadaceae bacterium]